MNADELESKLEPYWSKRPVYKAAEIGPGWFDIVSDLVDRLSALGEFEIFQIKEKFGGLRFYAGPLTEEQQRLVQSAEALSLKTCEDCGNVGQQATIGYWMRTLCQTCCEKAQERYRARWNTPYEEGSSNG